MSQGIIMLAKRSRSAELTSHLCPQVVSALDPPPIIYFSQLSYRFSSEAL
jgi:hypothetical protein